MVEAPGVSLDRAISMTSPRWSLDSYVSGSARRARHRVRRGHEGRAVCAAVFQSPARHPRLQLTLLVSQIVLSGLRTDRGAQVMVGG